MYKKACRSFCHCDYHTFSNYAIAFGLGITFSCFFPQCFLLFLAAIIIAALGIIVKKH